MAYEYDRFEREEGGGSFLMGLLAGTVLGAGLGMLFAPKAGSELRSQLGTQLADQTGKIREVADPYYQQATEKVSQIVDRGREAYDRARSSVSGPFRNSSYSGTSKSDVSVSPLSAWRMVLSKLSLRNWNVERLTATRVGGRPSFCQALACRHASWMTQLPIGSIRPQFSASGMKVPGGTRPRTG